MREYTYDEITVGQIESFTVTMTTEMEDAFRRMTGDENPLHRDDAYACEVSQGRFSSHVSFGMLTASFYSTINEHKSETIVKMHKRELSDHSQKGRLFPAILGKVKNK